MTWKLKKIRGRVIREIGSVPVYAQLIEGVSWSTSIIARMSIVRNLYFQMCEVGLHAQSKMEMINGTTHMTRIGAFCIRYTSCKQHAGKSSGMIRLVIRLETHRPSKHLSKRIDIGTTGGFAFISLSVTCVCYLKQNSWIVRHSHLDRIPENLSWLVNCGIYHSNYPYRSAQSILPWTMFTLTSNS